MPELKINRTEIKGKQKKKKMWNLCICQESRCQNVCVILCNERSPGRENLVNESTQRTFDA